MTLERSRPKTCWPFPLHPNHQSRSTHCLRFPFGDPDNGRITGIKDNVIVRPKLSGLSGKPDYRYSDYRIPDYRETTAFVHQIKYECC